MLLVRISRDRYIYTDMYLRFLSHVNWILHMTDLGSNENLRIIILRLSCERKACSTEMFDMEKTEEKKIIKKEWNFTFSKV